METFYFLIGEGADAISWWQMTIRALIIFIYALAFFRIVPRKALGSSAAPDIVTGVIIGAALSRTLTGNAPLLPTLAATAAFAGLYALVSAWARRSDTLSRLVKGRPILLVRNGQVDRGAMRSAQLGEQDLMENLRLQGLSRLEDAFEVYLERNGSISVIAARR